MVAVISRNAEDAVSSEHQHAKNCLRVRLPERPGLYDLFVPLNASPSSIHIFIFIFLFLSSSLSLLFLHPFTFFLPFCFSFPFCDFLSFCLRFPSYSPFPSFSPSFHLPFSSLPPSIYLPSSLLILLLLTSFFPPPNPRLSLSLLHWFEVTRSEAAIHSGSVRCRVFAKSP